MGEGVITRGMIEMAGTIILMLGTMSAAIGAYVSHRASTNINLANLRTTIESMTDDIEGKVSIPTCNALSGRNRNDIEHLTTTLVSTHDIVIRLETKMDSLLKEDKRG